MKVKKSELYFYEMLRDFLYKYLVVQRKYSAATVNNYTVSLNQYRQYLREQKSIPFDKASFHCFTKEMVYDFCVWLRDDQLKTANTVNLRLSAIKSFLSYCSEEDVRKEGEWFDIYVGFEGPTLISFTSSLLRRSSVQDTL